MTRWAECSPLPQDRAPADFSLREMEIEGTERDGGMGGDEDVYTLTALQLAGFNDGCEFPKSALTFTRALHSNSVSVWR